MSLTPYPPAVESLMRHFFRLLNERDRRRYAAVEASKLGHGGQTYISQLFHCDRKTLCRGLAELHEPEACEKNGRVRRPKAAKKQSTSNQ
jgi:hypothetical protein